MAWLRTVSLWQSRKCPLRQRVIYTPLVDPWFEALAKQLGRDDPQVGRDFALKNVLQQTVARLGQPKDIAVAVCFIASPLSAFMTGTTFRIDGGATPTVRS
jgi:3-oxoacyl-[acyl-carrier protein] reductase